MHHNKQRFDTRRNRWETFRYRTYWSKGWFSHSSGGKALRKVKNVQKSTYVHDVFGNFYTDFEEEPGYCFTSPVWLPSFIRDEPLIDQISGLVLCSKTDFLYEWWGNVYGNFKQYLKKNQGVIMHHQYGSYPQWAANPFFLVLV